MTFQRSIYLSFFAHIALFGTAIVFAQLDSGMLWGHRDMIMVSLVDPGIGPGSAAKTGSAGAEHRQRREKKAPEDRKAPVMPSEQQAERQPSKVASLPQRDRVEEVRDPAKGTAGKTEIETGSEKVIPDTGTANRSSGFGVISSEEWAVISSAIERSKSYPRMARERGIQGVTRVRFRLKQSGEVEKVEIVKSSGSEILDAASVQTLLRAGRLPYVSGWVEVPIAYVLK